jgi:hypothetical protein
MTQRNLPFSTYSPDDTKHLNMIIYGLTGAGKTFFAGTAMSYEATRPALLIDVDRGTTTLRNEAVPAMRDITIARPGSWKEVQEIYDYLYNDNRDFRSVIIDPLNEVHRVLSMGTLLGEIGEDAQYLDLGKAAAATRQDWLRAGEQVRKFIRAFRDLAYLDDADRRVHVIMLALEKTDEQRSLICPQLPGALGTECGAFVDILGRLSIVPRANEAGQVEDHRHLLVREYTNPETNLKYLAKNRGNRLGASVWDPTVQSVLGAWEHIDGQP